MTTVRVLTLLLNKFRVSLAMNGLATGCWWFAVLLGELAKTGEAAYGSWVEGLEEFPLLTRCPWDFKQREGRILGDFCVQHWGCGSCQGSLPVSSHKALV